MDTGLARTFLAVMENGSFVAAAQRLHVTQSTVSARIQRLEDELGARLFDRMPDGCVVTAAGRQFQRHAALLTRVAEQARQEIGTAGQFRDTLVVGGRVGLWEELLSRWLAAFARSEPAVAVRAHIGFEEDLMQALIEGRIDVGVMYVPQVRPGLQIELLFEDRLVLVGTGRDPPAAQGPGYVYVDWGPEFFAWHSRAFPGFAGATVTANVGWLGLQHVLASGGSGYFPLRQVREALRAGRLHRAAGAPEFTLPAYLCFPTPVRSATLATALDMIRDAARAIDNPDP